MEWPNHSARFKAIWARITSGKYKNHPDANTAHTPLPAKLMRNVVMLPRRTASSAKRRLERFNLSLRKIPHKIFARRHWMQLGRLRHYKPRPFFAEKFPVIRTMESQLPSMAIVTPSFQQAPYIERTIRSVLDQNYPRLCYVVQDGGSTDGTRDILEKYAPRLHAWACEKDNGQADAVVRGFHKTQGDIMAWLNSDDMLMPGVLHFVGDYFARHPDVDAVYGHRVLIDIHDREIGRWVLPPHRNQDLRFVDYVPQETLFWRRKLYEKIGGVDTRFYFALDWDLLLRFQRAGGKIVRLPYFMACFRVHPMQKTSAEMNTRGVEEMNHILEREHGKIPERKMIDRVSHSMQLRGVMSTYLLSCGIRR